MRWRTFMTGWTTALVVLLIAHPKPPAGNQGVGTAVVEFSYAATPHYYSAARRLQADARTSHPQRVVAPLVVMDVTSHARSNPNYLLTVEDIAEWEQVHGDIPPSAVVMARSQAPVAWRTGPLTATASGNAAHFPGFSEDAIHFLVEARAAYGLGTDTPEHGRSVVLVYRGTIQR